MTFCEVLESKLRLISAKRLGVPHKVPPMELVLGFFGYICQTYAWSRKGHLLSGLLTTGRHFSVLDRVDLLQFPLASFDQVSLSVAKPKIVCAASLGIEANYMVERTIPSTFNRRDTRPHYVSQMTQGLLISQPREVLYVAFGTDSDFTFAVWWWRRLLRLRTLWRNRDRRNHTHYCHRIASQWAVADVETGATVLIALLGCRNSDRQLSLLLT
jgi:hypothetical protein